MSDLSFLEKLLDGAEVAWLPLGEVFHLRNGYTPSKARPDYWDKGDIPWFRMEDLRKSGTILSDSIQHIHKSGVKGKFFPSNSIIMATTATIGEHALISVDYMSNQRFTNFTVKDKFQKILDTKFIYYYFFVLGKKAKQSVNISSFPSVQMNELKKWEFPIPCPDNPKKSLEIQGEIVRILDAFTSLTAELTAELTMRKKQYNHYRNQLLTFEEGEVNFLEKLLDGAEVAWLPLGDETVGEFVRGSNLQKKDFTKTGVGCIHYGQLYTHYGTFADETKSFVSEAFAKKARMAQKGNLVIATTSENDEDVCKAVAWLGNEDIAVSSDACIYKHGLNAKYVSYFFQTEQFQSQKRSYITGAKVRRVNASNLAKIKIPIPCPDNPKKSLEIQGEIVRILDKFDALTNSITEGLPREIDLRQKQYEHYRDWLLNFPKPEKAAA